MSKIGYIKDYRKELDSDIWKMPPMYHRVWQWIKYSVNFVKQTMPNNDGSITIVEPGQRPTSYRQIAREVGYYDQGIWREPNVKTIKSILDWLEIQKMISVASNRKGTMITVLQWDLYQFEDNQSNTNGTQSNSEGTPKEQKVTVDGLQSNSDWTLLKKAKKDKKVNNNLINGQDQVETDEVENETSTFFPTVKVKGKDRVDPNDASHPFNVFWNEYPRRVKRMDAERSFKRNVKDWDELRDIIINIKTRQELKEWTEEKKQYIPHPTTYLNNMQWQDEVIDRRNTNHSRSESSNEFLDMLKAGEFDE